MLGAGSWAHPAGARLRSRSAAGHAAAAAAAGAAAAGAAAAGAAAATATATAAAAGACRGLEVVGVAEHAGLRLRHPLHDAHVVAPRALGPGERDGHAADARLE